MNRRKVISFENVLLIDENKMFHRTLKSLLKNYSFRITSVSDVFRILNGDHEIMDTVFDLIIMEHDYNSCSFEKMDLFLNSSEKFREVPRIILTSFGENVRNLLSRQNVVDVVYKPLKVDELLNSLHRAVENVRILIVGAEDSKMLETIRRLDLGDYTLTFVQDPIESLKKLEYNHYKLIIVTEDLEDMSLFIYCTWVRTLNTYKTIPILPVCSILPDTELENSLKTLGISNFILLKELERNLKSVVGKLVFESESFRSSDVIQEPSSSSTADARQSEPDVTGTEDIDESSDMDGDINDMFDKFKDIL